MEQNKTINTYETLFVADLTGGEEAVKATVEKFKGIISENGTIDEVNEWGKRRFEYPINDKNEGYYTLVTFKANAEFPAELERLYGIDENIMRSIVLKLDEKVMERVKARAAARAAAKAAREAAAKEAAEAEAAAEVVETEAAPADAE